MKFSEKLLYLRMSGNYSQELLAEKLGVSRQAISKWEQGITLPETEKLIVISDFFDMPIDYLIRDNMLIEDDSNLPQLVIKFISAAQDMEGISKEVVNIMKDGVIDEEEKERMKSILATLDEISLAIAEIKRKMNM